MLKLRRLPLIAVVVLATASLPAAPLSASQAATGRRATRTLPPLSSAPRDSLTRALVRGNISEARYALERAVSLFDRESISLRYGRVSPAPTGEATLLLRDLAVRVEQLGPAQQRTARRVLARPTDGSNPFPSADYGSAKAKHKCSRSFALCFFWAAKGRHAPNPKDSNPSNNVPDWVDKTIKEFEKVWRGEVITQGYRPPKRDKRSRHHGPNGYTDIYLSDLGDEQVYGYCTTDDPHAAYLETDRYPYSDVSAYCVVDEDFSRTQFPDKDPVTNLRVTAAHEFFHAIQFAYDFYEDAWFMEGTAVAMEDQIYDGANDNYQYLPASPLVQPEVPIDRSSNDFSTDAFLNRYGAWVFWRFLTEYLTDGGARDPKVIREVWEYADGSRHGQKNLYSLKAAVAVANDHATDFQDLFADFGAFDYIADLFYEEGSAYQQYVNFQCAPSNSGCTTSDGGRPPFTAKFLMAPNTTSGRRTHKIDHLATRYVQFTPEGVSTAATLNIDLDAPDPDRGGIATLLVFEDTETPSFYRFTLDENGDGTLVVPFGTATKGVLVLTNASTNLKCGKQQPRVSTACQGLPEDDDAPYVYTATLLDP
ncbi:MAG: hypothetical protein QOH26_2051 [Actinomycetota bacterium]|nr:hypothetical protein [Actinomycetota bacterium]